MRIVSYNVNGIRAAIKKGLIDWLKSYPIDVLCVQETKATADDIDLNLFTELGYQVAWYPAQKKDIAGLLYLVRKSQVKLYTEMDLK